MDGTVPTDRTDARTDVPNVVPTTSHAMVFALAVRRGAVTERLP
jgi:hypothetical protein